MAVTWSYTPPTVNAITRVAEAGEEAVGAAAAHLLDASKRLVPVDTGALRDTGRVSQDHLDAAVSYGEENEATGIYAIVQHERLDFAHPNGGQAKYLEQPMHAEHATLAELLAGTVRQALLG